MGIRVGGRARGRLDPGRRFALWIALGGALLASAASPAPADPPGGEGPRFGPPHLLADNNIHTFHNDANVRGDVATAIDWARQHALDQPTSMTTDFLGSYHENVDVHSFNQYYTGWANRCWEPPCPSSEPPGGVAGLTTCESTAGTADPETMCQRWSVRYDLHDADRFTGRRLRSLACHELGHTVGFFDYQDGEPMNAADCMFPVIGPDEAVAECYHEHQLDHINAQYPTPPGQTQYPVPAESECSPPADPSRWDPDEVCCDWGGNGGGTGGNSGGTYRQTCDTVGGITNGELVIGVPGSEIAAGGYAIQNCA